MSTQNTKQDVAIAKLEVEVKNLKDELKRFITNDFKHLRDRVDWILWIFILGTLLSIAINLSKG